MATAVAPTGATTTPVAAAPSLPSNAAAAAEGAFAVLCLHNDPLTDSLPNDHHHQHEHHDEHHDEHQHLIDCTATGKDDHLNDTPLPLPSTASLPSSYAESVDKDSDFDSRRASVVSAVSSIYSTPSVASSSATPPLLQATPTAARCQQPPPLPLTRSRRDAKKLHAARIQRAGLANASGLLSDKERDHENSSPINNGNSTTKDWDWTARRASSTSPSPSSSPSSAPLRRGTVSSTTAASSSGDAAASAEPPPPQQQQGGLTRMAFAEQQRWIKVQEKTFTKWLNTKLQERDLAVKDLVNDLSDGVMLIHLLECLSSESLGRYAAKPKLRVQRFENANTALNFIKSRGIQMTNIGAEDVVDGNRKIILGLIWTLILRFTISDIHAEGMTAKEGLLLWCQRKTACYDEVDVRDFSSSWSDGLAFCALLDIHRPDLIDYDGLDKRDRRGNMQLAFDLAHRHIGIPALLDVEDVCDVAKPDERSLMTYIAYWFHAFSQMEKVENAGRRVEKFVNNMQGAWEMQSAYERRMAALLAQVRAQVEAWRAATFAGTYADAKEQAATFAAYKRGPKRAWVAERSELATLLGNIKTKLGTYRLRPYDPPAALRLDVLDREWAALATAEMNRGQLINDTIRNIKNALRTSFADKANDLALALNTVQLAISGLEGDVGDQLHHVRKLADNLPPLDAYLAGLADVDAQCQAAHIDENDFPTYHTYDELRYELGLVKASVAKKLVFLENQMVARSMTNLTPIQLEEFESVFRHFDRDGRNALQELEFSAALASLGLVFSEDEMHEYFVAAAAQSQYAGDRDRVTFEQFIRFMVDVTEDQNTAEQVFQSFREVADGKPYVTEMDLRHSLVPDEVIDKLVAMMPRHAGPDLQADRGTPQYDYISFMGTLIGDGEEAEGAEQQKKRTSTQPGQKALPSTTNPITPTATTAHPPSHRAAASSSSFSSSSSSFASGSQSPRKAANGFY
ncbi:BAH-domain containing protein [Niveomyces insectorum RCEF 264]|uniref:BAH-domain containing protein n=1 Tax=Niveomyces insectorum RCEF 264 TaxID=1081102 RepID=A0A167WXD3_9HYPO|nr:BAH-domain containing protein [Niveomyces insectorum RCEF 264]